MKHVELSIEFPEDIKIEEIRDVLAFVARRVESSHGTSGHFTLGAFYDSSDPREIAEKRTYQASDVLAWLGY